MAKANVGAYNKNLVNTAKENDKEESSGLNLGGWETGGDNIAEPDKTNVATSPWDNYYDPYSASVSGKTKPEGAKLSNNLDDASIDRLKASEIKAYGVRDYEAFGPINRMLRWGTSGFEKQSEDEYYAQHLKASRTEDEQKLVKEAEQFGITIPEGNLWEDNEALYKNLNEDISREKAFRQWKEGDDYQRLSNLSGGIDTNNDGKIDTNEAAKPRNLSTEGYGHDEKIKKGQTITLPNGKQYRYKGRDDKLWAESNKGSSRSYDESRAWEEIKEGDADYWYEGRDDKRLQFDVADLTRDDYENKSAEWLTGLNQYQEEDATASWIDKGIPKEVDKYLRDNPGLTLTDAMKYWNEEGSPEAKEEIAQRKAQDEEHREYMKENKYSSNADMAHAQMLFNNLQSGNINPDGSPMTDQDIADAKAAEEYQAKFDAEELQNFIDNDPYGRTPERVRQEEESRKRLAGGSILDQKIEKLEAPVMRNYTWKDNLALKSQGLKEMATNIFGRRVHNVDKSGKKKRNSNPIDMTNSYANVSGLQGGQNIKKTTTTTYNKSEDEKRVEAYKANIANSKKKTERDPGRTIDDIMADKSAGFELDMYGNRIENEYGNWVMADGSTQLASQ